MSMTIDRKKIFNLIAGFFICVLLLCTYLYKADYFPMPSGDEASLLNIPYRAITFGDLSYPVFSPQYAYDAGLARAYPPINAFFLRILYHFLVGFSLESSRVFSALLMLFSTFIAVGFCKKFFPKLSSVNIIIPSIAIGLTPAMFLSARTSRFEQEILFWGILGTLGVLILLTTAFPKRLSWFLSGICVGLAATSHPYGLVFPTVIFCTFLLHRKAWNAFDLLTLKQRIFSWGAGLSIPVVITLVDIFYKFQGYLDYLDAAKGFYNLRKNQFIEIFSNSYHGIFADVLPAQIKAALFQVSHYSLSTEFIFLPAWISQLYCWIVWVGVGVIVSSFFFVKPSAKMGGLPVILPFYLVIGFLAMTFLYPPNQTYYIYLAFVLPMSFVVVSFYFAQLPARWFSFFSSGVVYVLCFLNAMALLYIMYNVIMPVRKDNLVSADFILNQVKNLNTELKLPNNDGTTIIDSYTWAFANKSAGSWTATLGGLMPAAINGAAFRTDALDFFINYFPTETKVQVPEAQKLKYFNDTVAALQLRAILLAVPSNQNYYFYTKPQPGINQLQLQILTSNSKFETWLSSDPVPEKKVENADAFTWTIPQDGRYLLLLQSVSSGVNRKGITFTQQGLTIKPLQQSVETTNAPLFYLFNLQQGELQASNISSHDVVAFLQMNLAPALSP